MIVATVNVSEIYSSRHKKVVFFYFIRCSLLSPLLTGILARGMSVTSEHELKLTEKDGASFLTVRKRGL